MKFRLSTFTSEVGQTTLLGRRGKSEVLQAVVFEEVLAVVPMLMRVSTPATMAKMPAMKSPTEEPLSCGTTGA